MGQSNFATAPKLERHKTAAAGAGMVTIPITRTAVKLIGWHML